VEAFAKCWGLAIGMLVVSVAACAHTNTRQGALAAAANELRCESDRLQVTEYGSNQASVEGCGREGHFSFFDGEWRLVSRCEYRVTPTIRHCCTPNRGGERTCVVECRGYEDCQRRE
jgi:hypothetical protein